MRNCFSILIVFGVSTLAGIAGDIERGKAVYNTICMTCHGPNLDGGIGPSLIDGYWRHGSSPQQILEIINKGVPGSEMLAFEAVFPEADRLALRDFIVSEQEGFREVVRGVYPPEFFEGKELIPDLFKSVESTSQTRLPENVIYLGRNVEGVLRVTGKVYIKDKGTYHFVERPSGRTAIYLDGKEVLRSDISKSGQAAKGIMMELDPGVYDFEVLHEEKASHSYKFSANLQQVRGKHFKMNGRSLEGNIPKIIAARPEAQVVRKWIKDLPPRTLLCLLPNKVIVAYNPENGKVEQAWHSAAVNQTPSLPDRSAKPSEVVGTLIEDAATDPVAKQSFRFLRYEIDGDTARIVSVIDGEEHTIHIRPEGDRSFTVSID